MATPRDHTRERARTRLVVIWKLYEDVPELRVSTSSEFRHERSRVSGRGLQRVGGRGKWCVVHVEIEARLANRYVSSRKSPIADSCYTMQSHLATPSCDTGLQYPATPVTTGRASTGVGGVGAGFAYRSRFQIFMTPTLPPTHGRYSGATRGD